LKIRLIPVLGIMEVNVFRGLVSWRWEGTRIPVEIGEEVERVWNESYYVEG
jgi:hypothetical protein